MTALDVLWARCLELWDDDTKESWEAFAAYVAADGLRRAAERDAAEWRSRR